MTYSSVNKIQKSIHVFQELVLMKQTLFALPWLIAAAFLPYLTGQTQAVSLGSLILLFIAFFSARVSGMCFNRVIDMHIDAKNPRTKNRTLPRGDVSQFFAVLLGVVFLGLFFFAACSINRVTAGLSVIIGFLLVLYSYTKRFTYLCHFVLGMIHFFTPLAAWATVTGKLSLEPFLLSFSLASSIIANDLVYACQDIDFDREHHVFSIPAVFGVKVAIYLARLLHGVSFLLLVALAFIVKASAIFYIGCALIGFVYFFCHAPLMKASLHSPVFERQFSLSNIFSGIILLTFVLGEYLWRAL